MLTSWHENAFRITGPLFGESIGDVEFVVGLNKLLEKGRVADDVSRHDAHLTSIIFLAKGSEMLIS